MGRAMGGGGNGKGGVSMAREGIMKGRAGGGGGRVKRRNKGTCSLIKKILLGLGWGDIDVAIKELKTAIQLRPNFRMFHLSLESIYRDDQYANARTHLNKVALHFP